MIVFRNLRPALLTGLIALGSLPLGPTGCTSAGGPFPVFAYSDDGDLLPKPSSAGLVVDPNSPIEDVPKPIGFVGVPSRSTSRVDGNSPGRAARLPGPGQPARRRRLLPPQPRRLRLEGRRLSTPATSTPPCRPTPKATKPSASPSPATAAKVTINVAIDARPTHGSTPAPRPAPITARLIRTPFRVHAFPSLPAPVAAALLTAPRAPHAVPPPHNRMSPEPPPTPPPAGPEDQLTRARAAGRS